MRTALAMARSAAGPWEPAGFVSVQAGTVCAFEDRDTDATSRTKGVVCAIEQQDHARPPTLDGPGRCLCPSCPPLQPLSLWSTAIPAIDNQLINRLPASDQRQLVAACEPVQWRLSEVVCEPGSPVQHAYFPVSGFLSLVAEVASGPRLEVGMVGREGMLGAELSVGVQHWPFHVLVQGAGEALRISAAALTLEMARSTALQRALHRYTGVTMSQLATSTVCLRLHPASARLARWMLMSQDRAQAQRFAVTSAFLAYMLGEPRHAVANAVSDLQQRRLIERQGDTVAVIDRAGLESAACSCYQAERTHYQHHLGL